MNSTDSKLLKRVNDHCRWEGEVCPSDLRTVSSYNESAGTMMIMEGSTGKELAPEIANFMSFCIFAFKPARDAVSDEEPNGGDELFEDFNAVVNAPSPQLKDEKMAVCRTKGFVRQVGRVAMTIHGDGREDNYAFRLYTTLASAESKLNVGTNPLGRVKEVYGRDGPVRIVTDDPDEGEEEVEVNSAADW